MKIEIKKVDYRDTEQAKALVFLLDAYASDPMGGGEGLQEEVKKNLANSLVKLSYAFSYIAYVEDEPAGLINCFEAFSTFACMPLVNIHDIVVLEQYRGLGLSQKLLANVEERAKEKGYCKITLEVLGNNEVAKNAYAKFGFEAYKLDPKAGEALFWEKKLIEH
jgi:ribosomal protein S18 acetylase RimI-like enzyme